MEHNKEKVKAAIKAVKSIESDSNFLYRFAGDKFRASSHNQPGKCWYDNYEIIDENTIRIKYQYGGGDLIMDGSFDVKID